jgi:tRNA G18 (ribose-2'-O)-methylase SpoU
MQVAAELQDRSIVDREISRLKRPLLLILDNIRSAYNVGAIFRTADGIGVNKLYLCGITPTPKTTEAIGKTSLGAENTIPWEYHPNGVTISRVLKYQGYNLIVLERTAAAQLINDYHPDPSDQRITVLVIGNEKAGVDPGIIEVCDRVIALPMMGEKASLNVAVAFGAAAYWLSFI